nr:unnamed protein product [Spirometra erinaceieuropaei]
MTRCRIVDSGRWAMPIPIGLKRRETASETPSMYGSARHIVGRSVTKRRLGPACRPPVSLFTSIPPALAIDTIDGFLREKYDETDQQLKRAHIIDLLELCLKTFFTFNGQVYEQKKGTPMGSPLSGLIAEAVLRRLEQQVFSSYPPKFWARYVDDTFLVIKRSEMKAFKTLLNSIFPDIQFTMEEEVNNQLPFLDVQVTRLTDGKIRTTVYRNPPTLFPSCSFQNIHSSQLTLIFSFH